MEFVIIAQTKTFCCGEQGFYLLDKNMHKTSSIQCSGKINIAREIPHFTLLMLIFKYFYEFLLLKVVDIHVILLKKRCLHLISSY